MSMDTFYTLGKNKKVSGKYIGSDPNFKYQSCLILEENNDKFLVSFSSDEHLGNLVVELSKDDIFLN